MKYIIAILSFTLAMCMPAHTHPNSGLSPDELIHQHCFDDAWKRDGISDSKYNACMNSFAYKQVKQNERIIEQNDEIIRLLKLLTRGETNE